MTAAYRPSNGSEGYLFRARFCDRCSRDAKYRETGDGAYSCQILNLALIKNIDEPGYPKEWVQNNNDPVGKTARSQA